MKKCSRCGVEKPKVEFSKCSRNKDGLARWCKSCASAYDKEYRSKHRDELLTKGKIKYQENREEILSKQRQHYHENKEKYKLYREENKERIKAWQAEYRKTHKREATEYQKRYYKEHSEARKKYRRDKTREIHKFKQSCVKCGEHKSYMIDLHHINPSEKEFEISQLPSASNSRLIDELKKCICLCRNCHAEFHWIYGNNPESPVESLEEYLGKNPYDFTVDISQKI